MSATATDSETRRITYNRAIAEALFEEMERDDDVFVLGQMVAAGGQFATEQGLAERFGTSRVRDTGITEAFMAGCTVGAAIEGLRPVVNMGFGNFGLIAGDEIYHKAAWWRYMHGGKFTVPAVFMLPSGGGFGGGPEHSSSLEALGMHFPGLKVVVPSNPADAKGLLKSAIRDDNPVLFHSAMAMGFIRGPVPTSDEHLVPIGEASTLRSGDDLTVITYGPSVPRVLEAAGELEEQGVHVEVLDLRSLVPLDYPAVFESVRRTRRAIVVHDAWRNAGPGAEIAATVSEALFDVLASPVRRVAALDVPVPMERSLEAACLPSATSIRDEVLDLLR